MTIDGEWRWFDPESDDLMGDIVEEQFWQQVDFEIDRMKEEKDD